MGKVYKNKKRSCGLCKPHKRGMADKNKPKVRQMIEITDNEVKEHKNEKNI